MDTYSVTGFRFSLVPAKAAAIADGARERSYRIIFL